MTSAPVLPPRPAVNPPGRWRFPVPRRHKLGNGVTVLARHVPGQHAAAVLVHLAVPATAEPDGQDGIAAVMAASLLTGARGVPAPQFAQRAAASGITWRTEAGWSGPVITLDLPARQVPAALDLLRLALAEPALDPAETMAQARLAADGIARAAAAQQTRVLQELPAALYGNQTRAGRPAAGTAATVSQLTPAGIARFHDSHVRPPAVTIVIAGDLAGLDTAALAAEAFASWRDNRPTPAAAPRQGPLPRRPPAAVLVGQPGAAQARLLLAVPVPGRGEPGWAALQVAARILGAPVTGRLDARIRDRAGKAYGIHAGLTELVPGHGLLLVTGAVDGPAAPAVLAGIKDILAEPLTSGFTGGEHAAATEGITRTLPLAFETPAAVAAASAGLAADGLPSGYHNRVLADITALTAQAVSSAYASHLRPGQLTLVAAGDAGALTGPLEELAGALRVVSA